MIKPFSNILMLCVCAEQKSEKWYFVCAFDCVKLDFRTLFFFLYCIMGSIHVLYCHDTGGHPQRFNYVRTSKLFCPCIPSEMIESNRPNRKVSNRRACIYMYEYTQHKTLFICKNTSTLPQKNFGNALGS